ncbi:MAG: class I SAM-dependent methyltransferase [Simkaniaceae bacterium]|nr:class I SAM-dependent methyltransferase [Candidatus Sacchlamyda saccharinae]
MKTLLTFVLACLCISGSATEDFFQSLTMDTYLKSFPSLVYEGHVDREQGTYLLNLVRDNPSINNIAEIGFNAGHSSEIFLLANLDVTVLSFDLGVHNSVQIAKKHIDDVYSGRHSLILGNSLVTVPHFHKANRNQKFDLIFIDGGHTYEVAIGDIINMKALAHENTILVMDDLVPQFPHGVGPTKAWEEAKNKGIIRVVEEVTSTNGRKKWGKAVYNFNH